MNRQAVIGLVFVIILIVIGWQVYGMLGSSTPSTTIQPAAAPNAPAAAGPMSSANPTAAKSATVPVSVPNPSALPNTANSPNPVLAQNNNLLMPPASMPMSSNTQIQPASVMPNDLLRQQQQNQNKYITMVNDLQLLKVQRDIAETNQAIAAAELAKVTAEKGISDALTKPSQFAGGAFPPGRPGNQLPLPAPPPEEATYTIVSVSMQGSHWTALLDFQGKLFSACVGDVLPIDNSKVVSISRNGVVLRRGNKNRRISILATSL